jgi:hypothetical protein
MKIQILSPDGITLDINVSYYRSRKAADKAFEEWSKRYEAQGYYSSARYGRIPFEDLKYYCQFNSILNQ